MSWKLPVVLLCLAPAFGVTAQQPERVADMSVARGEHTATLLLDGRVLVAGGRAASGLPIRSAELFDPANGTWTAAAGLIEARAGHSAIRLDDGRVLIAGGSRGADEAPNGEIFDPATNGFTAAGPMVSPRFGQAAAKMADGRVLFAGGTRGGTAIATVEIFDPGTGQFLSAGTMATLRIDAMAAALHDGRVVIAGGGEPPSYQPTASTEIYLPGAGLSQGPAMSASRASTTAVTLLDGRVYIPTGHGGVAVSPRPTSDLYDPAAGTFSSQAVVHARHYPTVTRLADGSVLIAGGVRFADTGRAMALRLLEVFDPKSGTSRDAGTMVHERRDHATVALADGRALIVGGTSGTGAGTLLKSAEVWTPLLPGKRRRVVRRGS
jgi:hypothetical protein